MVDFHTSAWNQRFAAPARTGLPTVIAFFSTLRNNCGNRSCLCQVSSTFLCAVVDVQIISRPALKATTSISRTWPHADAFVVATSSCKCQVLRPKETAQLLTCKSSLGIIQSVASGPSRPFRMLKQPSFCGFWRSTHFAHLLRVKNVPLVLVPLLLKHL